MICEGTWYSVLESIDTTGGFQCWHKIENELFIERKTFGEFSASLA